MIWHLFLKPIWQFLYDHWRARHPVVVKQPSYVRVIDKQFYATGDGVHFWGPYPTREEAEARLHATTDPR